MNWTPVDTKLPSLYIPVLVTDGKQILIGQLAEFNPNTVYWEAYGIEGYKWDWDVTKCPITHWANLPPLP